MSKNSSYMMLFELGAKVDQSFGAMQKSLDDISGKLAQVDESANKASFSTGGMIKAAAGLAGAYLSFDNIKNFFTGSTSEAMKFESAMADVAKVVDGLKINGKTTNAYAKMSEEVMNMPTRIPMVAEDITKLIAAAGQSGIAANELTRFAEDAAKMGVAFDLPAEKAGEMSAIIRSSLRLSQDEFVTLADKVNYFGNTTTQSADKLIQVVQETGLIGRSAGVSADQIAAMSAAMDGMDAANMSTALSNIYGSLMTGAGATDKAIGAWKTLGFTSEQVAKDMLRDSEGTMLKVFEAMKKLPKDQLASTTAAIFGNNKSTKMAIASFTQNLDVLKQNFVDIGDATKYAGSMQAEFDSRAATTENSVQLMKNSFANLQIAVGNVMLPIVAEGAEGLSKAIEKGTKIIPNMVKGLVTFSKVVKDLSPVLGGLVSGLVAMKAAEGAAKLFNKLKTAIEGVTKVGSLFAANPALIPVTALATVVGVGVAVWRKYKEVQEEAYQAMLHSGEKAKELADNVQAVNDKQDNIAGLKERFIELSSAIDGGKLPAEQLTQAQAELATVKQQLIGLSDGLIASVDQENNTFLDSIEALEKLTETERQVAIANLEMQMSETNIQKLNDQKSAIEEQTNALAEQIVKKTELVVKQKEILNAQKILDEEYRSGAKTRDEYNASSEELIKQANKLGNGFNYARSGLNALASHEVVAREELVKLNDEYTDQKVNLEIANANVQNYNNVLSNHVALTGKSTDSTKDLTGAMKDNAGAVDDMGDAYDEQARQIKELYETADSINEKWKDSEKQLTAQMTLEADARGMSLDAYKDKLKEIENAEKAYATKSTNMWSRFKQEDGISIENMISNIHANSEALAQWRQNLETLAERGLSGGLINKLQNDGPEMAKNVHNLLKANTDQIQRLNQEYANGLNEANLTALQQGGEIGKSLAGEVAAGIDDTASDVLSSTDGLVDAAETSLQQMGDVTSQAMNQVKSIVQAEIPAMTTAGETLGKALATGFQNTIQAIISTAQTVTNAARNAIQGASSMAIPQISNSTPRGSLTHPVDVPQFATGGIVTAPTLAMIGEGRENEAILPLSKLDTLLDSFSRSPKNITSMVSNNFQNFSGMDAPHIPESMDVEGLRNPFKDLQFTPAPANAMIEQGRENEAVMPKSKLDTLLDSLSRPSTSTSFGAPNFTVQISPSVVIQGNADADKVKNGVSQSIRESIPMLQSEFDRMMANYQDKQRRVSFAQ